MYTMQEMARAVDKSSQSIYRLIRQNKELQRITTENKLVKGKVVTFRQPVLDWLIDYYKPDLAIKEPVKSENELLIEELRNQINSLNEQLRIKDEQIKHEQENAGMALLQIQEERNERIRLLEAPKENIFSRLFGWKKKG